MSKLGNKYAPVRLVELIDAVEEAIERAAQLQSLADRKQDDAAVKAIQIAYEKLDEIHVGIVRLECTRYPLSQFDRWP